ncbi:hypothetical protein HAX54_025720, partial [Datura stramonium]|nr:hypothetical protein [Datura stramonium]
MCGFLELILECILRPGDDNHRLLVGQVWQNADEMLAADRDRWLTDESLGRKLRLVFCLLTSVVHQWHVNHLLRFAAIFPVLSISLGIIPPLVSHLIVRRK